MKPIKPKLPFAPEKFLVLVANYSTVTEYSITYLHAESHQDELSVLKTGSVDIDDDNLVDSNCAIVLMICGKGIKYQRCKGEIETGIGDLTKTILPLGNPDDYYEHQHYYGDNDSWASICRKQQLDDLLTSVRKLTGGFIVELVIGPVSLGGFRNLIDQESAVMKLGSFSFQFEDDIPVSIHEIDVDPTRLHAFEDVEIPDSHLPHLAILSEHLSQDLNCENNVSISVDREEYSSKVFVEKGVAIMAFAVLIILLVNYTVSLKLNRDIDQLNREKEELNFRIDKISEVEERIIVNQNELKELWPIEPVSSAWMVDQLLLVMPSELTIEKIKGEMNNTTVSSGEYIQLSGIGTGLHGELGAWMDEIKAYSWVKSTQLLELNKTGSVASFTISINV